MNRKNFVAILSFLLLVQAFVLYSHPAQEKEMPKNALKYDKKGDKAFNKKEYHKALEYYIQALEAFPDGDMLHYKIASIMAYKKDFPTALDHLKKAHNLNPEDSKILLALANTMLDLGKSQMKNRQMKMANTTYLDILKLKGVDKLGQGIVEKVNYQVGVNYFNFQNYQDSQKYLLQFLTTPEVGTRFPDFSAIATYIQGTNLLQLREYEKSKDYLEKFINMPEIETKYPPYFNLAHYLTGINFSELEKNDKAIKYFSKYLVLNPKATDRYVILAKYKVGSNHFELLKREIREIEKKTNKHNIKEQKKKIEKLAKDRKVIKEYLEEAVSKDDKLEPAYTILGNYYYLCGDLENARKYYKLLIDKFPGSQDGDVYKAFLKDIEKSLPGK